VKLMCKCGNIEDIKTDKKIMNFVFKNCDAGKSIVCKKCNEVVFIKSLINRK
jgi:hypothetical protein